MKKIIVRFFVDHEKEEKWINDMAEQGWHLQKFWSFVFIFEKGEPGAYIYRNEMVLARKNDYLAFLETMDIERVHHFAIWYYFRKKRVDGPFKIYTDPTDKIRYLAKLNRVFIVGCLANLFAVIMNGVNLFQSNDYVIPILFVIVFNFLVAVLCSVAIRKNTIRKKKLKENQLVFES